MSSSSLNLTNTKTDIFNDIYLVRNNDYISVNDIFYAKDDPTNSLVTQTELDDALITKANTTTLNNFMVNTTANLALKSNLSGSTNINTTLSGITAFSGTVNGLTKATIGLANVDNTSDVSKTFNQSQITNLVYDLSSKAPLNNPTFTSDVIIQNTNETVLWIKSPNTSTGASNLYFNTNTTNNGRFFYSTSGLLQFRQNNSATGFTGVTGFEVYPNGTLTAGTKINNKLFVLYETGAQTDDPITSTNFIGFGVNAGTLRYQVNQTTNTHKFYCGSTLSFTISSTGGVGPSDIRFKTDIENITNGLDKITQLQGKSFYLHSDRTKRQLGLIAQEVLTIIPEVVQIDTSDENNYLYMAYDKLIPVLIEAIKELNNKIVLLENRVNILENNI